MSDRREEILNQEHWKVVVDGNMQSINTKHFPLAYKEASINAMDEYMKECAIDLLSYIGEKCVCFDYDEFGQLQFQLKEGKHWVTKEQLFENFL
jgi:hypothetical protein